MLVENTLFGVKDKVKIAIDRLQTFEPPEGYYLAFDCDTLIDETMFKNEELTEEEAKEKVDAYEWEKVITVSIQPYY